MDDKLMHKFINIVKDKFIKQKQTYQNNYEYAFSTEEIENINKQNKQKIQELKQHTILKNNNEKPSTEEVLSKIETSLEQEKNLPTEEETTIKPEEIKEEPQQPSFINLNPEHQKLVMDSWNAIKLNKIDKDIIDGKDLLNHNYTITYADDAAKFIHYIRKEYEIVICYLIGFNNEKQGLHNKTIFSNKIDDEWKHLNSYIKILEKIRNFKK